MPVLRTVLEFAFIAVLVYVAFGAYLYVFQRSVMYHPSVQDFSDCPGFADSEKIRHGGTRMYLTDVSEKLVVFYHGNAGSACDRAYLKDRFSDLGYSSLFVEYTGFSNDSKTPTKERILENAEDAAAFVEEHGFENVTVMGSSLGSSPAAHHASVGDVDRLVLISPYDSVADVAKEAYPFYPVSWLLKDNFDNVQLLEGYDGPTLILHAEQDSVVSVERGRSLHEQVGGEFVVLDDVGHNQIYNRDRFWDELEAFLP